MPELPEVETTARDLRPQILGERIVAAHILWTRTIASPDSLQFSALVTGERVVGVGRRGKYVLIELESGSTLLVHLRMSGRLRVLPPCIDVESDPHVRVWFELGDGRRLVFTDARKFGRMWLVPEKAQVLAALGPEPLESDFTSDILGERLRRRKAPIKNLLLDQTLVAGIGNIYADESLFIANIHPLRPGSSLTDDEILRLHAAILLLLQEAVGLRGTTLRDYVPPYGSQGNYQENLRVYGRNKGEPCPECGTPIERIVIAQRSAHYCPHCQPAGEIRLRPRGNEHS